MSYHTRTENQASDFEKVYGRSEVSLIIVTMFVQLLTVVVLLWNFKSVRGNDEDLENFFLSLPDYVSQTRSRIFLSIEKFPVDEELFVDRDFFCQSRN